ncbi:hypothetical protein Mpt1_c13680 [Candidatus Methanoplasma termitum]|uniref:Uncharacterized protein n=2 Tax=Candidatus Methanoplasma termitum TaxID=1577791 RepID=A0A0A7LDS7_9ARCH|nr:hypothetical protein Mpt1_c13680 [Candidatus Methanoplasma termitum]
MTLRPGGLRNKKYFYGGGCGFSSRGNSRIEKDIDLINISEAPKFIDALNKWGFDRKEMNLIEPIVITGPIEATETIHLQNGGIKKRALFKVGRDGIMRGYSSSTYIMGFTEKQIALYIKVWNVEDFDISVRTEEIFYRDVVSINVRDETVGDRKYCILTLQVPGSDSFSSGYVPQGKLNDRHIQAVKNLIRDKKMQ